MRCLVTGAAGFIGSHLCEHLLRQGHEVTGIDAFIPYYPREVKEQNLVGLKGAPRFHFIEADLRTADLAPLVADIELIYHIGAMAGLLKSWTDFDLYWTCNVLATQRLLEAVCRGTPRLQRLLYASTSSVYGSFASGDESLPTKPVSPYGVTKLAGEHLCRAYGDIHGVPVVCLRFFSVYGPRQRPDMGYYKFIRALLLDEPVPVYGDGQQVCGNTYITDCVEAVLAATNAPAGETYNIGGGETASLWDIFRRLEQISGRKFRIRREPERPGDQRATFADTSKLRRHFGWQAKITLDEGLRRQWEWQNALLTPHTAGS